MPKISRLPDERTKVSVPALIVEPPLIRIPLPSKEMLPVEVTLLPFKMRKLPARSRGLAGSRGYY